MLDQFTSNVDQESDLTLEPETIAMACALQPPKLNTVPKWQPHFADIRLTAPYLRYIEQNLHIRKSQFAEAFYMYGQFEQQEWSQQPPLVRPENGPRHCNLIGESVRVPAMWFGMKWVKETKQDKMTSFTMQIVGFTEAKVPRLDRWIVEYRNDEKNVIETYKMSFQGIQRYLLRDQPSTLCEVPPKDHLLEASRGSKEQQGERCVW